jgi:hypothetical protein
MSDPWCYIMAMTKFELEDELFQQSRIRKSDHNSFVCWIDLEATGCAYSTRSEIIVMIAMAYRTDISVWKQFLFTRFAQILPYLFASDTLPGK